MNIKNTLNRVGNNNPADVRNGSIHHLCRLVSISVIVALSGDVMQALLQFPGPSRAPQD